MNVIILAAGLSNRLFPLTKKVPKAALALFGSKSLLTLTLQNLVHFRKKIHVLSIIGGHGFNALVEEVDRADKELHLKPKILYNSNYKIMNNCYSLLIAINDCHREDLLIMNSDILYDPEILKNVMHSANTALAIDNVKDLTAESMKVDVFSGRIIDISKKLPVEKSYGEYIGIAKIKKRYFKSLQEHLTKVVKNNPDDFYEEAFRRMMPDVPFSVIDTDGRAWTEIDDAADLDTAKRLFQELGVVR